MADIRREFLRRCRRSAAASHRRSLLCRPRSYRKWLSWRHRWRPRVSAAVGPRQRRHLSATKSGVASADLHVQRHSYISVTYEYNMSHKKCHFIFHYNSLWIFTLYVPMETARNALQRGYKICNLPLTVSSIIVAMVSAVRMTVTDGFLQCVRSNWLCVTFAESHPMFVFYFLLGYCLMSLWAENLLHSRMFLSKFYLQNSVHSHIPFHCIIFSAPVLCCTNVLIIIIIIIIIVTRAMLCPDWYRGVLGHAWQITPERDVFKVMWSH